MGSAVEVTAGPSSRTTQPPGAKRKGRGGLSNKIEHRNNSKTGSAVETTERQESGADTANYHKKPRREASCPNFREKFVRLVDRKIKNKKEDQVEEESEAIRLTAVGPENQPPCRKVIDFILHDADGIPQPFEMSEIDDLYITALMTPMDEDLVKAKEKGVRCEGFGRIESWSISGYDEGTPVIWVITETAEYECVKPSSNYKKFFDRFHEKACVCIEAYKILAKSQGGDPNLSLEEMLARVVRAMSSSRSFPSGSSGLEFVISLGEFIFKQLIGLDENPESNDDKFSALPVLISLKDLCQNRAKTNKLSLAGLSGTLKINDGNEAEAVSEDEDAKLARLLQEEEEWKVIKQRAKQSSTATNKFYIKITEDEIANDYPLPVYYKPTVLETDEYIFFDSDDAVRYSDALPTRILDNWSLYNSDSRLISLELLPMKPCAEIDVTIFGSGYMRDDDGSGFCVDVDMSQPSTSSGLPTVEGVPVYLSAIKEWMIEFGSSMVFISIRTEMAWYRLGKPARQYAPWYEPILKTARLAICIISLLKEQSRASKLSFSDVIKRVSEFEKNHPAHISSYIVTVERYVVVHGQIILQQFAEYPDEMIRRCAFVTGLSEKMELRHHTKLLLKKKVAIQKGVNMNPSACIEPIQSKRKVMRATTTKLINQIWSEYYANYMPEDSKEDAELDHKEEEEIEDQEENEDEEADPKEDKVLSSEENLQPRPITRSQKCKVNENGIEWEGISSKNTSSGEALYRSAHVCGDVISVGRTVIVDSNDLEEDIVYIEYMFEKNNGVKMFHGRVMKKGSQTVLGNAANERELFMTNECSDFELADVKESILVDVRSISWGHSYRNRYANRYKLDWAKAEERKKKGLPVEYFCKSLYWPQRGAFFVLPFDMIGLGTGSCHTCKIRESSIEHFKLDNSKCHFTYKNNEYHLNDFVYVRPEQFDDVIQDTEKFKAGKNVGLKAYVVCQVLGIEATKYSKEPIPENVTIRARRFYRPEDVSSEKAHRSDIREIYYSEDISSIPVEMIEGKCDVREKSQLPDSDLPICHHVFFCEHSYNPRKGSLKQLPEKIKFQSSVGSAFISSIPKKNKGKGKGEKNDFLKWKNTPTENRLVTLDIFSGCGGLSEGLQQSGVSYTKWAIEYEKPAGEAFMENHPDAVVFIDNCNVILRAIMEKCGDADDCISTSEATELAAALDEEKLKNLPLPGQVDFINGGPPCQGFSGMNRFSHGIWSKVQCEMILAFLSYADYFRPKFFLLENVRTFVSFNKGQTFRLTLASLLEMGYQVRFGILEAGAYGVSQSRKRAFIWAASPEETLPEWPEPMHVFASPELKVSLPGDNQYAAVRSTAGGAPFRSITVRDTIGDLPPVSNGASRLETEYGLEPLSWFQKQIRGNTMVLSDHISKEMNELNLIRCQHIPKKPGADWRDLPEKKVKLSTGQMVDLIPWCLPNTAKRHNQWKGLFGRLDWEGNFPTSITDPQPMGKVGMCFHPDQDRILTVRECARSQGFRDSYRFSGNIQNKHRQIGNAVPPPLAYALGLKLKEVVDTKGCPSV